MKKTAEQRAARIAMHRALCDACEKLCPAYLAELAAEGKDRETLLHHTFPHVRRVADFAVRAILAHEEGKARAVFDAWLEAVPSQRGFPTSAFAEEVYRARIPVDRALLLVPASQHADFAACMQRERDAVDGYDPQGY